MLGRRLAQVHSARRAHEAPERETFIALRACRKALDVARRVRFSRPVDISHTYCQSCGAEVDCSDFDDWIGICCTSCGEQVRVPGYVRGAVRAAETEEKRFEMLSYGEQRCVRVATKEEAEFAVRTG